MRYAEFILVMQQCNSKIQDALYKNIPMTYELFCECSDRLVEIGAYETTLELSQEYPEYTERNLQELGLSEQEECGMAPEDEKS